MQGTGMRSARWKFVHGLGLSLFVTQLAGAFEVAQMQQPKFYFCAHTKQKIEKGKPCPCGCDKRLKALARAKLLSADHPCAGEADEPVLPAFARWVFMVTPALPDVGIGRPAVPERKIVSHLSYYPETETPPPRMA